MVGCIAMPFFQGAIKNLPHFISQLNAVFALPVPGAMDKGIYPNRGAKVLRLLGIGVQNHRQTLIIRCSNQLLNDLLAGHGQPGSAVPAFLIVCFDADRAIRFHAGRDGLGAVVVFIEPSREIAIAWFVVQEVR